MDAAMRVCEAQEYLDRCSDLACDGFDLGATSMENIYVAEFMLEIARKILVMSALEPHIHFAMRTEDLFDDSLNGIVGNQELRLQAAETLAAVVLHLTTVLEVIQPKVRRPSV